MFNRKTLKNLEFRLETLEKRNDEHRDILVPFLYGNREVTLNDLIKAFKAFHTRVTCSSHWKPKQESPDV